MSYSLAIGKARFIWILSDNILQYPHMRTAKTVCITLPPELLNKAQKLAVREHRTMSELFREALRRYMSGAAESERSAASAKRTQEENEQGGDERRGSRGSDVLHSFRMEKE